MRLLYVTVVVSLVSMIVIGSYLYAPAAGLKMAVIQPATENIKEINGVVKRGDTLLDIFRKYKEDMEKFIQAKKI